MRIDIMTLFPQMCEAVMNESIIGRAQKKGVLTVRCHQIREYTDNRQKQVDDYPYGGGMGLVMYAQPIDACFPGGVRTGGDPPALDLSDPSSTGAHSGAGEGAGAVAQPVSALRPL